jgi:hypothetical protein
MQPPRGLAPRVLISYSHDNPAHCDRVLALADRLRADGIDAVIDQFIQAPPEGWPAWCAAQIDTADFVLMVCTETYLRRVNRKEEPGVGHGVLWEARLINQYLYDAGSVSAKFVPVLLADGSDAIVPLPVKGGIIYRVETPEGYESLLRLLSDQPLTPMPPLGSLRSLPPRSKGSAPDVGAEDLPTLAPQAGFRTKMFLLGLALIVGTSIGLLGYLLVYYLEVPLLMFASVFGVLWGLLVIWTVILHLRDWQGERDEARRLQARHLAAMQRTSATPPPSPSPSTPHEVFVSYSWRDDKLVSRLVQEIESSGPSVWIDRRAEVPGMQRYAAAIVAAIRSSRLVALMCSHNAFASDHVVREIYVAGDLKKPFIAFELDNSEIPDELLYFLSGFPRIPAEPLDPRLIRSEIARFLT